MNFMAKWNAQLYELREMDDQQKWEKRVGHARTAPWGRETPLGHIHSMIAEEAARQGIEYDFDSKNFLEGIKRYNLSYSDKSLVDRNGLATPCYYPDFTRATIKLMKDKGFNAESCSILMKEALGPDAHDFSPESIKVFYFSS